MKNDFHQFIKINLLGEEIRRKTIVDRRDICVRLGELARQHIAVLRRREDDIWLQGQDSISWRVKMYHRSLR